uniref:Alpha-2-macroglobulin domain-containing protein n=1 Tax=Plectus sambesii TaxID=2011161 RepID=A0A914UL94_9BILA
MKMHFLALLAGAWSSVIDIGDCMRTDGTAGEGAVTLTGTVRDRGSGDAESTQTDIDLAKPGFELVPLRPGFTLPKTTLPILVRGLGGRFDGNGSIELNGTCVTQETEIFELYRLGADIGDLIPIDIQDNAQQCAVIIFTAQRIIGNRRSRPVTLAVPSLEGTGSLKFGLIALTDFTSATYTVRQPFQATVPADVASQMMFMVICNEHDIAKSGRVRDDGVISFEITEVMVPQCVLYVYKTDGAPVTDMIQFYVRSECPYHLRASGDKIAPAENVTLTISGGRNGLATIQAIDERLSYLLPNNFGQSYQTTDWDIAFFDKLELKYDQVRVMNFLDTTVIDNTLMSVCMHAGRLWWQRKEECLLFTSSSSEISNMCQAKFRSVCNNTGPAPTANTICDQRDAGRCEQHFESQQVLPSLGARPGNSLNDIGLDSKPAAPKLESVVRELFPEVWLFNDYSLNENGQAAVALTAPDTITRWSFLPYFWTPGKLATCQGKSLTMTSYKKVHMIVDLPKHVYINESLTAKVTVFGDSIDQELRMSICFDGLGRSVCGDMGADGELGQPTYTRIILSPERASDSKTYSLKFLKKGPSVLTFALRTESALPGVYHCRVGELLDRVQLTINVAERSDIDEHYQRLILNPSKPLTRYTRLQSDGTAFNEDIAEEDLEPLPDIIEYYESRSRNTVNVLQTHVASNLLGMETLHSISVEVSRFLANNIPDSLLESSSRRKRAVEQRRNAFLTDILKDLSAALYKFKALQLSSTGDQNAPLLEVVENNIGVLLSEVLSFSDCHQNSVDCGFAQKSQPLSTDARSLVLSTLTTSLLCEADFDETMVCGALKFIMNQLEKSSLPVPDFDDQIDLSRDDDKMWFWKAMILRLSQDCGSYLCVRNDRTWLRLYKEFYQIDDNMRFDQRTIAAVAYMGTNSTRELMRTRMLAMKREDGTPYWTTGASITDDPTTTASSWTDRLWRRFNDLLGRKMRKSGDILVNALGMLALTDADTDNRLDMDDLADWLYEQQHEGGTYENALDTYFASRALYEYRAKKEGDKLRENLSIDIQCRGCRNTFVNVTESSSLVFIPTTVRNFTIVSTGLGKIKVGVRVLATRRQRTRRHSKDDVYYPVHMSAMQERVVDGIVRQQICLEVSSAMLDTIEITHGLFTGYTTTQQLFNIIPNSPSKAGMKLVRPIEISGYAVHFVLTGLTPNEEQCYEVGIKEPSSSHEPDQLAPIAVTARHPVYDVIGQHFLSHPDRTKRSSVGGQGEQAVDSVCFDGGNCACAETSCKVMCKQCTKIDPNNLIAELCRDNAFGAIVEFMSEKSATVDGAEYAVLNASIKHWTTDFTEPIPIMVEFWLRKCNVRCLADPIMTRVGYYYFIGGTMDGWISDQSAKYHYVMRSEDRLEVLFDRECESKNILSMVTGLVDYERRCTQCKKSNDSVTDCLRRHR